MEKITKEDIKTELELIIAMLYNYMGENGFDESSELGYVVYNLEELREKEFV